MGRKVGSDFPRSRSASQATMFHVTVSVGREAHSRKNAYYACAMVDKRGGVRVRDRGNTCAYGAAPRRAAAKALAALGRQMIARSSAFRGMR